MKFNKYRISHYFIFSISGLNYLIAILLNSFFRRKNNKIMLFGHKLVGNLEAIFKDTRLGENNFFYMTLNYRDYLYLKKIHGNKIATPLNIFHLLNGLRCKIVITSHGIFLHNTIKKLGIKTILCGHAIDAAIPKNKEKIIRYFELFDEVWLHSPYHEKIVSRELLCKSSNLNMIGYPRNQLLIENSRSKENLKIKNNLDGKKVILYAPTSNRGDKNYIKSEFSPFNINFYKFMKEELLNSNIVLIVKTHLNDIISEEINALVKKEKNIFFKEDMNVSYDYDLMILSDVLVTDLSTIYVDYLLLEKPIYLIDNPDPDPSTERSSILKYIDLPKIHNDKELKSFIVKLKGDKLESENIINLKNNIYGNLDHLKTIEKINQTLSSDSR